MDLGIRYIMIRRILIICLAVTLFAVQSPMTSYSAELISFTDVPNDTYYYNPILWATRNNITTGTSEYTFSPEAACTRGQIVTFLWRAAGSPEPASSVMSFGDVGESDFYYKAVLWAVENGITNGYGGADIFAPDVTCTRGQVVTMLNRYLGGKATNTENPFDDVKEDAFYYDAVLWAAENGITTGTSATTFEPDATCTRGQIITFLWRAIVSDVNAVDYGLSINKTGLQNSITLQKLIDDLSHSGGAIYIPSGEYIFSEIGQQKIGSHCINMKSNVSIIGDGSKTVLKPVGESEEGLDMFYFNEYGNTGIPTYLMNCNFENFVIDADGTSCKSYTTAGKGFMFNLFRNCHWRNVIVMNTDATGFGVDCPIDSSIVNCTAIGCGKAATTTSHGASGFGIGFGYSENESMIIDNCSSYGNTKFGFFFEHQGRFGSDMYLADGATAFIITNCTAANNYYNFGGMYAMDTKYKNCISKESVQQGYFFEKSARCEVVDCTDDGKFINLVIANNANIFSS